MGCCSALESAAGILVVVPKERETERETERARGRQGGGRERESLQMVFKRRQKATARTESEEEEERAAVTAHSGLASSAHHSRLNNCTEKAQNNPSDRTVRLVYASAIICPGEVNSFR